MQDETIKAGKTTITRSRFGTVRFIDAKGHERRIFGDPTVNLLVDAIRDGSGKTVETIRRDTPGVAPLPHSGPAEPLVG